ncbi:hypothetical protein ACIGFK_28145 [Streptomyces sp. NPDC085524]|uniref:hypothetical protein n=1 Tax=unclassified Streptomyces TaxID=2593676 RepID=UPI0036C3AA85
MMRGMMHGEKVNVDAPARLVVEGAPTEEPDMPFPVAPEMPADALLAGDAYARATPGRSAA